jgi:hypothetical protein
LEEVVGLWTATGLFLEIVITKRILLLLLLLLFASDCRCILRVGGVILIGITLVVTTLEAIVSIFGLIVLLECLLEGLQIIPILLELLLIPKLILWLVCVLLVKIAVEVIQIVGLGLVDHALQIQVSLVSAIKRLCAGWCGLIVEGGGAGVVDDGDLG